MLDLLTVVTYNAIVNFALMIIATIAWARNPRQKEIIFWATAAWFMVIGAVFTSMTEALPYNIMGYIGGTIYVAQAGFMRLGFKEFYGQTYRVREAFFVSGFVFLGFALAELAPDPTSVRISLIYLGSSANLALGAWVLWQAKPSERLPSASLAAVIYAGYALACLLIAPLAILYPVQFVDRMPISAWMTYTSMLLLIFNLLSFMMAMVLKLERSSEVQRQLAERDNLTGLLNRRVFFQDATKAGERGIATMAVLDLDHFKRINDTYGHKGGDDALVQFAGHVSRSLPAGAIFGRLGGEEFGICLPGYDATLAQRMMADVLHRLSLVEICSGQNRFKLTFSCGIAVMRDASRSLDGWMADADAALYLAKDGGRNRVVVHASDPPQSSRAISRFVETQKSSSSSF